jgi:transmembrane sensor
MTRTDPAHRLTAAAAWRARLTESTDEIRDEFAAWLLEDPRNAAAWRKVQAPWELLGEHASAPAILRLRRAALAHAYQATTLNFYSRRAIRSAAVGMAALLVIALAGWKLWSDSRFEVYRTNAGERRVITLSDGSQVALDSQSEVKVRYGTHSRTLTLVAGQARFEVAHDVLRPFSVVAGGREVIATGTVFNVDLMGSELFVTLIEGHVTVLAQEPLASIQSQLPDRIALDAGEQLVVSPSGKPKVTRVNVERTTAWQNGQLVFEDEPLGTVLARISRYGTQNIVAADAACAELRISGVFREGDIEGFLSTITSYLPVTAQQMSDGSIRVVSQESRASTF